MTDNKECPALCTWDYKEEAPMEKIIKRSQKCQKGHIFQVDIHGDEYMAIVGVNTVEEAHDFLVEYLFKLTIAYDPRYLGIDPASDDAKSIISDIKSRIDKEDVTLWYDIEFV
ncbi:MAG: hypothetical protein ACFFAI_17755 [Promethearchaeota archaeon]